MKTVLITGASRGLGLALARALARQRTTAAAAATTKARIAATPSAVTFSVGSLGV